MNKLATIVTEVPPHNIGGESLIIKTDIIDNGDGIDGIILHQEILLESYGNAVTMTLCGNTLTPSFLRDLADQIEGEIYKVKMKLTADAEDRCASIAVGECADGSRITESGNIIPPNHEQAG